MADNLYEAICDLADQFARLNLPPPRVVLPSASLAAVNRHLAGCFGAGWLVGLGSGDGATVLAGVRLEAEVRGDGVEPQCPLE